MSEKRFIIWDPNRGDVPRSSDGGYLTSGLIGVIGLENAYLVAYPALEEGAKKPDELEVHESIMAFYSLGGSKGHYQIIRIR